ncbi:GNAT family N-acetyltransferase [Pseudomonas sp. H9]|uniref:GNAT family N-acetyltransferase n=1 Tax=Pseudomonas sp. H9 TaxID=483968 RepID=UPI00105811B9|nr:GNAT family N-acetyltransferase [Pseudomonas sp. H9]TDF84185.1 N-acetyltransferase [Pseudomonas sp. H9]
MPFTIRPAHNDDADLLPEVERSAAQAFLQSEVLHWIASQDVLSVAQHRAFIAGSGTWVLVDADNRPQGFLCGQACGDDWHIVELSVAQAAQGQGHGRRLITTASTWARANGFTGLTLTTFTCVPWNAPFYTRLGFERLDPQLCSEFLQRQLAAEQAHGLSDRCAMRLDL